MADCNSLIMSEEVEDFIVEYNPAIYNIAQSGENSCAVRVNQNWMVAYGASEGMYRMDVGDLGYYTIPKLFGLMDTTSLDASGITSTLNQPFLNIRGQGVLIGFIDTGIDYMLDIFKFRSGMSKIAAIWDQTIQTPEDERTEEEIKLRQELEGNFPFGTIYTGREINVALDQAAAGGNPYEIVPSRDEIGHGTYLAGVAAGAPSEDFMGAAPESEIVMVKLKPAKHYLRDYFLINSEAVAFQENDIMMGVQFLAGYANVRNLPLVICFSLGTGSGPRTGATPLSSLLNVAAKRLNMVVAVCMGNEANNRTHVSGTAQSDTVPSTIEVNVGREEKGFVMELWASTLDVLSVSITSPSGETIPRIPARVGNSNIFQFLLENSEVNVDYKIVDPVSGFEIVFIRFIRPAEGVWRINVYSLTNISGRYNAWLPIKAFMNSDTYFFQSTPDTTLTEPSADSWVISVAAYDHVTGASYIESGRGYTADGRVKPDITAPGVNVYGPKLNGGYTYRSGTSVATALVAGAAALLLTWGVFYENAPLMGTSDVKYILIRGAVRDAAIAYPNNIWGYGKMDLMNSLVQMRVT